MTMQRHMVWSVQWLVLFFCTLAVGCGSGANSKDLGSSATFSNQTMSFEVNSALYAQVPVTSTAQDANGNLPQGTAMGIYLFSVPNACDALANLTADANGLLTSGPSESFPYARFVALANINDTLPIGEYGFIDGTVDDDLPDLPPSTGVGSMQGAIVADDEVVYAAQATSLLTLTEAAANVEGGTVRGFFSMSFGPAGAFTAKYCKNLGVLLSQLTDQS
jgi:hypothetical protein